MTVPAASFLLLAALAVSSCVTRPSNRGAPGGPVPAPEPLTPTSTAAKVSLERPLIMSLKMRDQTLRVTATGSGPRFMVERADGVVVAHELADAELAERFPELWEAYRSGYATADGYLDATGKAPRPNRPYLDSSMDP